jgi:four helix bundle protein
MAMKFEDLRVLQAAEAIVDDIWRRVIHWDPFARDVVGNQLARAADSIGANIAESFDRFHYGEKLQFLYYVRGSLLETKYWLNRALTRDLMPSDQADDCVSQLTNLARQLNAFAGILKAQRRGKGAQPKVSREAAAEYMINRPSNTPAFLFTDSELQWLQTVPKT